MKNKRCPEKVNHRRLEWFLCADLIIERLVISGLLGIYVRVRFQRGSLLRGLEHLAMVKRVLRSQSCLQEMASVY